MSHSETVKLRGRTNCKELLGERGDGRLDTGWGRVCGRLPERHEGEPIPGFCVKGSDSLAIRRDQGRFERCE